MFNDDAKRLRTAAIYLEEGHGVVPAIVGVVEALNKKGFAFVEILSPCPTLYSRRNRLGDGLEMMKYYKEASVIRHGANTKEVGISYQGPIIVGKFVDVERPTFLDLMNQQVAQMLDAKYVGCGEERGCS